MSQDNIELTIRSTLKKIDEMNFRCPLVWSVYQLKAFVAMSHQQGQEYFKPEKTQLYYGGNILDDAKTLQDVLKNKNLKQQFTFIAKFNAGLEFIEDNKETNEEGSRLQFLEDYSKLYMNSNENIKKKTNFEDLNVFTKLPLMMERVSKQLVKKKTEEEGNVPQEVFVNNNEEERNQNILNLAVRMFVIYLLFGSYFNGLYFYLFIAVLAVYFLIKLSQRRGRIPIQRQQQPQNQPRANAPNEGAQGQDAGQNAAQQPAHPENAVQPTFLNKVKEFFICYVCSLYPSWDMNLYIENHPVIQPENPENEESEANKQTEQETKAEGENTSSNVNQSDNQNQGTNKESQIQFGENKTDRVEIQEEEKEALLSREGLNSQEIKEEQIV